ncbi:MAG TPA: tRNA 2-thiocytidine(32) synthetase TtcA [Myxococcales bacterium]|nr:tRNA 2-thiocytidine(32) synthetase TtcA [Myxococcales bacterium]HAN31096.1 tRNA 2-thiocytidine(32) synthetase TtcA [Myxococcales bacterium]
MSVRLPVNNSPSTTPNMASLLPATLSNGMAPAAPSRMVIPDDPKKLEKRIAYMVTKAMHHYEMIVPGDKIMVCMSGGKDSYALLHFLQRAQRHAPFDFELVAVHLDQGHPGFPLETLEGYLAECGSPYHIIHEHTYDVVLSKLEPGKTTCSLCSRLRRGILYSAAQELGCTKVALGHHRDDIIATFLLNFFFCGQLKAMPSKLISDDGKNTVIRPLSYVPEEMIVHFAKHKQWPLIPCSLCSRQEDLKRSQMEQLMKQMDAVYPGALPSALNALTSVHPRFLLDRQLFDFNQAVDDTTDHDLDAFA